MQFRQTYRLSRQQAQMVHTETEDLPHKRMDAARAVSTRHMILIAPRCARLLLSDAPPSPLRSLLKTVIDVKAVQAKSLFHILEWRGQEDYRGPSSISLSKRSQLRFNFERKTQFGNRPLFFSIEFRLRKVEC